MPAEKKIAQKRLTLLQVAERIRNVSEACRRHSISRSQFYEYKRAFQERGFDGLMDRPSIPKSFPNETPGDVKEKIIALSLKHPAWGPVKISDQLRLEGVAVSPSTVRNLWIKENLETKYKRLLRLEEEKNGQDLDLTSHRGADPVSGKSQSLLPGTQSGEPLFGISPFTGYLPRRQGQGSRPHLAPGCRRHLWFFCLWKALHLQAP